MGNSKMNTYYKVVNTENRKLRSVSWTNLPNELIIQYKVGKKATAPVGGILVFEHLEDAIKYLNGYSDPHNFAIYTCRVSDRVLLGGWMLGDFPIDLYKRCWENDFVDCDWPDGTCAFKEVTLLKKIKTESFTK